MSFFLSFPKSLSLYSFSYPLFIHVIPSYFAFFLSHPLLQIIFFSFSYQFTLSYITLSSLLYISLSYYYILSHSLFTSSPFSLYHPLLFIPHHSFYLISYHPDNSLDSSFLSLTSPQLYSTSSRPSYAISSCLLHLPLSLSCIPCHLVFSMHHASLLSYIIPLSSLYFLSHLLYTTSLSLSHVIPFCFSTIFFLLFHTVASTLSRITAQVKGTLLPPPLCSPSSFHFMLSSPPPYSLSSTTPCHRIFFIFYSPAFSPCITPSSLPIIVYSLHPMSPLLLYPLSPLLIPWPPLLFLTHHLSLSGHVISLLYYCQCRLCHLCYAMSPLFLFPIILLLPPYQPIFFYRIPFIPYLLSFLFTIIFPFVPCHLLISIHSHPFLFVNHHYSLLGPLIPSSLFPVTSYSVSSPLFYSPSPSLSHTILFLFTILSPPLTSISF